MAYYKNEKEYKSCKIIQVQDINVCALVSSRKHGGAFAVFTPSRTYRLVADTIADAQDWVDAIGKAAATCSQSEEEDAYNMRNPSQHECHEASQDTDTVMSTDFSAVNSPVIPHRFSKTPSFAGDFSGPENESASSLYSEADPYRATYASPAEPGIPDHSRDQEIVRGMPTDGDDTIVAMFGYLYVLNKGLRQWRKRWVVLRSNTLVLYKSEEEYEPLKVIPIRSIIDVIDIDALSKTKVHCMRMILHDRSYRFCAPSEEALTQWVGSFKSNLSRLKGVP